MENDLEEKSVEELRQLLQEAKSKVQEPVNNLCDLVLEKANEILANEDITDINVVIKAGVRHSYANYSKRYIQYGQEVFERMNDRKYKPRTFFLKYYEMFQTYSKKFPMRYPVVSMLLEEVAHITTRKKFGYSDYVKTHGWQFKMEMRRLLVRYADELYRAILPYEELMR